MFRKALVTSLIAFHHQLLYIFWTTSILRIKVSADLHMFPSSNNHLVRHCEDWKGIGSTEKLKMSLGQFPNRVVQAPNVVDNVREGSASVGTVTIFFQNSGS